MVYLSKFVCTPSVSSTGHGISSSPWCCSLTCEHIMSNKWYSCAHYCSLKIKPDQVLGRCWRTMVISCLFGSSRWKDQVFLQPWVTSMSEARYHCVNFLNCCEKYWCILVEPQSIEMRWMTIIMPCLDFWHPALMHIVVILTLTVHSPCLALTSLT